MQLYRQPANWLPAASGHHAIVVTVTRGWRTGTGCTTAEGKLRRLLLVVAFAGWEGAVVSKMCRFEACRNHITESWCVLRLPTKGERHDGRQAPRRGTQRSSGYRSTELLNEGPP